MAIVPLTDLDHVFASAAFNPTQLVLHYQAELDLQKLEDSFAATAGDFHGVHATLARLDDHTYGFDMSQQAATYRVVQDEGGTITECVDPVRTRAGEPLARARVTRLGSRGTAIALSLSHCVADGYGYFLFLSSWAARSRGEPFLPPNCRRDVLVAAEEDVAARGSAPLLAGSGYMLADDGESPVFQWRERFMSVQELRAVASSRDTAGPSTNDLLSATLWKDLAVTDGDADVTFTCPVDIRRHRGEMGPFFFGNASLLATVTVPAARLREASVARIAGWIRDAVRAVPEHIDREVVELAHARRTIGLEGLCRFRSVRPDYGFLVSNLSRIPFGMLDFGAGVPIALHTATVPAPRDRSCAVFSDGDRLRLLVAV